VFVNAGGTGDAECYIALCDKHDRRLSIYSTRATAMEIAYARKGQTLERPGAHDVLFDALDQFGVAFGSVLLTEGQGASVRAVVTLKSKRETRRIDTSAADAVLLALRAKCPISIDESVFASAAGQPIERPAKPSPSR